jgi:hypothetical protein
MFYWEYEFLLEEVNNNIKEENERQEKENAKYDNMNPNSMMRNFKNSSNFKMPSFNSFK